MEMRCYRKILHIPYKDHVTNEEVRAKIQQVNGPHVRPPGHRKETQTAVVADLVKLSHKVERKKAAEAYSSPYSVSVSYLQKSVICRHSACE